MFQTNPEDLRDLLHQAASGRLQLPDFQRDYVWNDEGVRQLLMSVSQGFPVGALLSLETRGEVRFKPRTIAGTSGTQEPDYLLLDGQQRITSLHGALWSEAPVHTRRRDGQVVGRYYYLDMDAAAEGDIDRAIVSVAANRRIAEDFGRQVLTDLSDRSKEVEARMFPLNEVFRDSQWWDAYNDRYGSDGTALRDQIKYGALERISRYRMPVIRLDRTNGREAVCTVFEKVNTGGMKLDAFELLTAMFAADGSEGEGFNLREDWQEHCSALEALDQTRRAVLFGSRPNQRIEPRDFLQVASFLQTTANRARAAHDGLEGKKLPQVSIRHPDLLKLDLTFYKAHSIKVREGFAQAAKFLNRMKMIHAFDLPYQPLRVALAALFASRDNRALSEPQVKKLQEYVWAISLGETYGSSTETRIARDVTEVNMWLDGEDRLPRALSEATFRQERLEQLRMRISSAYKAVHVLLMSEGCRDFVTGAPVDIMTAHQDALDIHHIFPASWCTKNGKSENWIYDSIINKTALSARSNREIGGAAPSEYLARIEHRHGHSRNEMDAILRSHLIEPALLRADDFEAFLQSRREALTNLIAAHLRNPIIRELDPEPVMETEE